MDITNLTQRIEYWAAGNQVVYALASYYYKDIVHKEAQLANISCKDHVLCIGGGPCPFSAILMHQTTGAKITVIDNNEKCVEVAKHLITSMGLDNVIKVIQQDGLDVELNNHSVIHLALQVTPLEAVLINLQKKARPGTRFLIRRPKKGVSKLYSSITTSFLKDCKAVKHQGARNVGNTLLYIKQESFNESKVALVGIPRPHTVVGSLAV